MNLAVRLAATAVVALSIPAAIAAAAQPHQPPASRLADPKGCSWVWKTGAIPSGSLGLWAESCTLETGQWDVNFDPTLPGFVQVIDGNSDAVVVQAFAKAKDADIATILPELRKRGYIPDDEECVFAPASADLLEEIGPRPRTQKIFEVMPTGKRKAALDATPDDEVADAPCGDYGYAPDGINYFVSDSAYPDTVLYINMGQDEPMYDETTVTVGE